MYCIRYILYSTLSSQIYGVWKIFNFEDGLWIFLLRGKYKAAVRENCCSELEFWLLSKILNNWVARPNLIAKSWVWISHGDSFFPYLGLSSFPWRTFSCNHSVKLCVYCFTPYNLKIPEKVATKFPLHLSCSCASIKQTKTVHNMERDSSSITHWQVTSSLRIQS